MMVKIRLRSAFLRSPSRAAVTAVPMVMLDVIRMKVMSAMNGMLKTSDCRGQGDGLGLAQERVAAEQAGEEQGVGDDEDPHHRLLPGGAERRAPPPQCASSTAASAACIDGPP